VDPARWNGSTWVIGLVTALLLVEVAFVLAQPRLASVIVLIAFAIQLALQLRFRRARKDSGNDTVD